MKILINDLVTEYKDEGEGPIILMLHGWWRNMSDFDGVSKILTERYRIIRVDLPGFGGTQIPQKIWKVDDYVNFVKNFIDKLEIKPKVLIGHSFGGRIIIKGIAEKKLGAEKIILISAAGVKVDAFRKMAFGFLAKIGNIVSYVPPLIFIRRKLKNKFYNFIGSEYLESGDMKEIFKAVVEEDLTPFAKKINKGALLIWGEGDMQTPLKDGRLLYSLIVGSKLEIIPNSDHFVHIEEPQKVADIINDFVS